MIGPLIPRSAAKLPLKRQMTPECASRVRSSWPSVSAAAETLAGRFYVHLFAIDRTAAELFAKTDMTAQRAKLMLSLAALVAALDEPSRLFDTLGGLAKRHARYGVQLRHFDSVGDALLWALADTLGPRFTPELRAAWAEAYALIASVMKRAIDRSEVAAC